MNGKSSCTTDMTGTAPIDRRQFLETATKAAAALASTGLPQLAPAAAQSSAGRSPKVRTLIDCNVTLSRWPFRRLPLDETPALVAKLRSHTVTEAWAGTFEGVFHKNIAAANARLAKECCKHGKGVLVPFGSVNPTLPGWEDDLDRCSREHGMPGLRLHPNYHGYKLDDARFEQLLDMAIERSLIVQLVLSLEDERTQHPLMQVPHVDTTPLVNLLRARPRLRLVLLNWFRVLKDAPLQELAKLAYFDIATIEGVGGVANLLIDVPRLLFGSHAPFFYFESAQLKLTESVLTNKQLRSLGTGNARALREGTRVP
jgi:uncharacterized protein